jgi:hypothetical protein
MRARLRSINQLGFVYWFIVLLLATSAAIALGLAIGSMIR